MSVHVLVDHRVYARIFPDLNVNLDATDSVTTVASLVVHMPMYKQIVNSPCLEEQYG